MTVLDVGVIALGTAAAVLLSGSPRALVRTRLRSLLPGAAPPAARSLNSRAGRAVLWAVPMLPALTLALVAGPVAGALIGVPLAVAGWRRLARGASGPGERERARLVAELPMAVDLMAAGLRAGCTMPDTLAAVTQAVPGPLGALLGGVADQLRLGADPVSAWGRVAGPPDVTAVGRAVARAADSGAPVADLLHRQAAEIRAGARDRALARSQRLGVLVVVPLGVCFLPAFVLIGVVPLAAGLISGLMTP
ncbi:type II secretion system F family protein [Nocardiopsis sediminis]|uniref:Type II secretion system F family protein n=1 Tax=Nocardiopsis sediminis TaxID=1778267 RepID=A0ABV8FUU9_9ACTN